MPAYKHHRANGGSAMVAETYGGNAGSDGADVELSVVVPAYNEQEVLPEFHKRLTVVLARIPMRAEVIYVNDGSRDGTLPVLRALRATDSKVAIVDLSRN